MSKKSFIMYIDMLECVYDLTQKQRAELLTAITDYHNDNEVNVSKGLKPIWTLFKNQFDRDYAKYQKKREKRRKAAKARWEKQKGASASKSIQADTSAGDNDNVNVNDNVNGNGNEIRKEIVGYLNQKAGKKFQYNSQAAKKHINARIREGAKIEDFKKAIDNKVSDWRGGDMEKYLRPSTLFNSEKFWGYANESPNNKGEFKHSTRDMTPSEIRKKQYQ